ncbi:b(o/a)3-type cytochrome-c oxidase subunit 1 [Longirhabdus pacifica]|uniref:b(o/a)3-type cytochrome-c oxidase subunit 1 n=1 Tax=Longirhabdus pacifica TaxID=2305227 RepID=UPI0010089593|nr:b(o/a)3-type cytochrome-c oxidase subunit 1 [Longirhabdus pacifica]
MNTVQQSEQAFDKKDSKLVISHIIFAFVALLIGGIAGLLQGLVRSDMIQLPAGIGYYQLLTAHGVLMALIFTTFFIIGFLFSGMSKTLGGKLLPRARTLGWLGFIHMGFGTLVATVMILLNKATVLYTFYAPMQASPFFYFALVFVVVGTWMSAAGMIYQYRYWKKEHKGETTPLTAYMSIITMSLWVIATLGVAVEVIFQLIPWSLGWVEGINIMLSRTLFWYFGHPLVYFWLLPAYICWYVMIPKIIGGKIFSDALARLSFILFLLFSIPVGFHHQLMEPGISPFWKFLQVVLTFLVVIPSLMTAFSLFASFEIYGRSKGAKGLFGWFKYLPWKDIRFFAPFMGMLIFIPAGAGGLINASNQMNAVVHNTLFVTGHFHLTVATSVTLTFFGITYWLIPAMTGRKLTPKMHKLGRMQTWVWVAGMAMMSGAMHIVGLFGSPRRTAYSDYNGHPDAAAWEPYYIIMAVGGTVLFIAVLMMIYNLYKLFTLPKGYEEYPIGEVSDLAEKPPKLFERWGFWVSIVVILILMAYTIPVIDILNNPSGGSKGFVTW